ncbi:MAG: hypothetical protein ACXVHX_22720 [Solirubrobacteraceae bacterium]
MARNPGAQNAVQIIRRHAEEIRQLRLRENGPSLSWVDLGSQLDTNQWGDAGDWGEPPGAAVLDTGLVILRGYIRFLGAAPSAILISTDNPLPSILCPRNVTISGGSTIRRVSFALGVADNELAYKGAQGELNISSSGGVALSVGGGVGLIGLDGVTYDSFPVGVYLALDGLAYTI